jgi:hypothetical protein
MSGEPAALFTASLSLVATQSPKPRTEQTLVTRRQPG